MATKTTVRDRAAEMLGILRLGQSLQHQDKVRLEEAYDEVYDDLEEEGLAIWASTGTIPNRIVNEVATLMAHNCLTSYTISENKAARVMALAGNEGEIAKRAIRKKAKKEYVSTVDPTDY